MSGKAGLHPVVIILAILIFGHLIGFLGVPLAAASKVLLEEAIARYKQSSLFSGTEA